MRPTAAPGRAADGCGERRRLLYIAQAPGFRLLSGCFRLHEHRAHAVELHRQARAVLRPGAAAAAGREAGQQQAQSKEGGRTNYQNDGLRRFKARRRAFTLSPVYSFLQPPIRPPAALWFDTAVVAMRQVQSGLWRRTLGKALI